MRDSEAFERALEIWSEALVSDDPTPRTFKRYLNRLRYFAAMMRVEAPDDLDWRREANLVALATLHHLGFDPCKIPDPGAQEGEAARARVEHVLEALRKHADPHSWKSAQGNQDGEPRDALQWPPDDSEIERFRKLSDGIHM